MDGVLAAYIKRLRAGDTKGAGLGADNPADRTRVSCIAGFQSDRDIADLVDTINHEIEVESPDGGKDRPLDAMDSS
jgi:hypothetical protein